MINRRQYLAGLASAAVSRTATFRKPLGVQLYTVRDLLLKDPQATIRALARIGFREIEGVWRGFPKLVPLLKQAGLRPVSLHVPGALVTGNWRLWESDPLSWQQVIDEAKPFGLRYLVIPYVRPDERGKNLDAYRKLGDELNRGGEQVAKAGMMLCYHHHAFEFQPMEGSSPFQVMMDRAERKLVGIEMDVFWVSLAGHDPMALLQQYSGRVPLVHLKDIAPGTGKRYDERVERTAFKEVGNGSLDFAAILKTGATTAVRHYFVEQDQCPGNPLESLGQSYRSVRKLSW